MKKYILPSIIAILLIALGFKQCQYNKAKDQLQIQAVQLSTLNDSVLVFKGKNGELTSKLSSVQVESDNAKKALEIAGFEIKELKDRNVKWRDIVFALKAELEIAGGGSVILHDTITITKTDTIKTSNFKWNNNYLWLSGSVLDKKIDFNYKYKTEMNILSEQKGKTVSVSVYLKDPNAKIVSGNSITITPKRYWYEKWYIYTAAGLVGGYFIFK